MTVPYAVCSLDFVFGGGRIRTSAFLLVLQALSPLCYPISSTDSVSANRMYIETEQRLFPAGSRLYFQSDNATGSVMDVAFTLLVKPA